MKRLLCVCMMAVLPVGCALPLSVNQHLDAIETGLNIAVVNASNAHDSIESGIAEQRSDTFEAARADLERIAAKENGVIPVKTASLVVEQLQKQSKAYDVLVKMAWQQRIKALDNFAALRRMLDEAKNEVIASQNVSQEVKAYFAYLEASRAAANAKLAETQATSTQPTGDSK